MPPADDILGAARAIAASIVADRRAIHQRPELAYEEVQTAAYVAQRLGELGVETTTGVGGTGVVGLLRGERPGRTVLLRADMDALPIQEQGDAPYRSRNDGAMHACGHDGHVAMLLGTARLLAERRDAIAGNVKLMFQPAEEGGAGAMRMIDAGILDGPKVDAAFAAHVDPLHQRGRIATRVGPAQAASDRFTVVIKGRGGHAARPHLAVDPVVIAAQVITALQALVSRETAPDEQAVVTVGSLEAGTAFNVIPDTATLRGTVRTYKPEVQDHLERRIGEIAAGVARAMRGDADLEYARGYPPVVNHEEGVRLVSQVAESLLGPGSVEERVLSMGSEDFSFVLQRVPGAMFWVGVRDPSWPAIRPIHSSSFDLDEEALPAGTAVMTATALRFLSGE